LAFVEGVNVDDVAVSGPSLLFGAYPIVFATLPGMIVWVRLLFFTLFLLGIDSAFAGVDAVVTVTADSVPGAKLSKMKIVSGWCFLGFAIGLLYATDAGFRFLDVFDFYINFLVILVGLFECLAVGWVVGLEKQCEKLGSKTMVAYMFTTFGSIIAACGVWFGTFSTWGGFVTWFLLYLFGMSVTTLMLKKTRELQSKESQLTWKEMYYTLYFKNVQDYVEVIKKKVGYLPFIWGVTIKHVIPPALIVVFVLGAVASNEDGAPVFGHYGGYVVWPYQVLGVLTFCFTAIVILVGVAAPDLYNWTFITQVDDISSKEKDGEVEKSGGDSLSQEEARSDELDEVAEANESGDNSLSQMKHDDKNVDMSMANEEVLP